MIYCAIWVITYSLKYLKVVWSGLLTSTHCTRLGQNGRLLKCLHILITVLQFKDRNWIYKTVYCISSLVVCKIAFCSELSDVRDSAGRKTRRRRAQAITKRYTFHANAISGTNKYIIQNAFQQQNYALDVYNCMINQILVSLKP